MTGKAISQQLSYLPDDMIEEAMETPKRPQAIRFTVRALRAAACLAVVFGLIFGIWQHTANPTAPAAGLLTVTVYGIDQDKDSNEVEELVLLPYTNMIWPHALNSFVGFPIGLSVTDSKYDLENISFRVSADGGWLFAGELGNIYFHQTKVSELDTSTVIPNNTAVFWKQVYPGEHPNFKGDLAFVEIIVYEGEQILGYTVIRLDRVYGEYGYTMNFYVTMPANVVFSPEDTVTEEYVREKIAEVKNAK